MTAIELVTYMLQRGPNANNGVWSSWHHVPFHRIQDIRRACLERNFTGIEFDFGTDTIRINN